MANRPSRSSTNLSVPSWLEGISVLRVNKLGDMQGAHSGAFEGWSPVISVGVLEPQKLFVERYPNRHMGSCVTLLQGNC